MHLLTFDKNGKPTVGIRQGNDIIDLSVAVPEFKQDMISILAGGKDALDYLKTVLPSAKSEAVLNPETITYLPPVPNPQKILCVGLNYADHAAEGRKEVPTSPVFFSRFNHTLVAHKQPLLCPRVSEKFDFEGELAVVIGKKAKHLTKENALSCVAGYSIFHDGSVRDYQVRTPQWTLGKNFDQTGGFGPEIVTADELPPGAKGLRLTTVLSGETMQNGNTEDFIFDVPVLLQALTETMTLQPGDVIITGTPAGVGFARKPPRFMKAGDVCEITIEGIGTLVNPVRDE